MTGTRHVVHDFIASDWTIAGDGTRRDDNLEVATCSRTLDLQGLLPRAFCSHGAEHDGKGRMDHTIQSSNRARGFG